MALLYFKYFSYLHFKFFNQSGTPKGSEASYDTNPLG